MKNEKVFLPGGNRNMLSLAAVLMFQKNIQVL
jgi:hypothetical protein